jgi:hypothetical protein
MISLPGLNLFLWDINAEMMTVLRIYYRIIAFHTILFLNSLTIKIPPMQKTITFFIACLLFLNRMSAQETISRYFYYNPSAYALNPPQLTALNAFIDSVKVARIEKLNITGHTDNTGGVAMNLALSQKRAQALQDYFISHGISVSIISATGNGMVSPRYDNATAEGKRLNRRTDFIITLITPRVVTEPVVPELKKEKSTTTIMDLYKMVDENQEYYIDPKQDTALLCKNGTILFFHKNTLNVPANTGKVEIIVKEVLTPGDMVLENASTTSDNQWLKTAGMVYLEARLNGKKVDLKPGANVTVFMPSPDPQAMNLWKATRDSTGLLNWQPYYDRNNKRMVYWASGKHLNDIGCGGIDDRCPFFFCGIREVIFALFNKNVDDKKAKEGKKELKALLGDAYKKRSKIPVQQYGPAVSKTKSDDNISYYIFNLSGLAWANCDFFKPGDNAIAFRINLKRDSTTDVKLMYKSKTLVSSNFDQDGFYFFPNAPGGETVKLVALKYFNGIPSVATKEVVISKDGDDGDFDYKSCKSISEFKQTIRGMKL